MSLQTRSGSAFKQMCLYVPSSLSDDQKSWISTRPCTSHQPSFSRNGCLPELCASMLGASSQVVVVVTVAWAHAIHLLTSCLYSNVSTYRWGFVKVPAHNQIRRCMRWTPARGEAPHVN